MSTKPSIAAYNLHVGAYLDVSVPSFTSGSVEVAGAPTSGPDLSALSPTPYTPQPIATDVWQVDVTVPAEAVQILLYE